MAKLSIAKKTALIAAAAVAMAPSIVVAQQVMNGEVGPIGPIGDDSGLGNSDGLGLTLDDFFGLGLHMWHEIQVEVSAQERLAEAGRIAQERVAEAGRIARAKTMSDAAVAEVQRREQEGKLLFGFRRPGWGPSYAERKAAAVAELDANDQRRIERARQQSQTQNLGDQVAGEVVVPTGEVVPLHRFLRGRDVADNAARVANMRLFQRGSGQSMGQLPTDGERAEAAYQRALDHHTRTIQEDEDEEQ